MIPHPPVSLVQLAQKMNQVVPALASQILRLGVKALNIFMEHSVQAAPQVLRIDVKQAAPLVIRQKSAENVVHSAVPTIARDFGHDLVG